MNATPATAPARPTLADLDAAVTKAELTWNGFREATAVCHLYRALLDAGDYAKPDGFRGEALARARTIAFSPALCGGVWLDGFRAEQWKLLCTRVMNLTSIYSPAMSDLQIAAADLTDCHEEVVQAAIEKAANLGLTAVGAASRGDWRAASDCALQACLIESRYTNGRAPAWTPVFDITKRAVAL